MYSSVKDLIKSKAMCEGKINSVLSSKRNKKFLKTAVCGGFAHGILYFLSHLLMMIVGFV